MADTTATGNAPDLPGDVQFDPEDDPVAADQASSAPTDGDDSELPASNPGPPQDAEAPPEPEEPVEPWVGLGISSIVGET